MTGNPPFNPFEEKVRLPLVRPKTRGECADVPRPCPFVSCRHHLYLDVDRLGNIAEHAADPLEMEASCSLDVADEEEPMGLVEIGRLIGINKQLAHRISCEVSGRFRRIDVLAEYVDAKVSRDAPMGVGSHGSRAEWLAAQQKRISSGWARRAAALLVHMRGEPAPAQRLARAIGWNETTTTRVLRRMLADGVVIVRGTGRETRWSVVKAEAAE